MQRVAAVADELGRPTSLTVDAIAYEDALQRLLAKGIKIDGAGNVNFTAEARQLHSDGPWAQDATEAEFLNHVPART
eukprot:2681620-Karenia_brevis.AAC.1